MTRAHRLLAGVLAAGALALTGCAQSVDPIERLGRKAAEKAGERAHHAEREEPARPAGQAPPDERGEQRAPASAHRRWGLSEPLAPAPRPPTRTQRAALHGAPGAPGLSRVVDRVPTKDKVVFLTFDDGAERDPRFVRMVRELRLPVSMFLTDSVAGPGYAHFGRLRAVGATVQNHTLDHPYLPGLSYAGQRWEICGQQDKLKKRFGVRPTLFRPPYGEYNEDTLRAAAACGIRSVITWRTSTPAPAEGASLHPGDIIRAHSHGPGGPLTDTTTHLLRHIQSQGYTVARLEDYTG
ncbi:Bifunctional xylanase/deacetylase precursor [Streptomyces sp. YIM 130001]|uniref:polysaccharide deacetylase family protein n=1 Tax=Streptomyces sp. YIM 130001 TaxID=2259644 RepID=UPI000EDF34B1|nr:polysaccharide deacetylase family protein [Streptomyces sp. YIM 130001]RII21010.1 Bifunctional xylanase/deacetylase precursor [Streptomyces sp. YIM 130001]